MRTINRFLLTITQEVALCNLKLAATILVSVNVMQIQNSLTRIFCHNRIRMNNQFL